MKTDVFVAIFFEHESCLSHAITRPSKAGGKQPWHNGMLSQAFIALKPNFKHAMSPGRVVQSVTCLATECESDCRSRGSEYDPGPVPYFCGDLS